MERNLRQAASRPAGVGLWLLLAGLATVLAPVPAQAAPAEMKMSLPASHGYRMRIVGSPGGRVEVEAIKGASYANYAVPGHVSSDRIEANLGRLGRVSVRFHAAGERTGGSPPSGCAGAGRSIHQVGTFSGTIRFRGEEGFTSVSATRAKGSLSRRCATEAGASKAGASNPTRSELFETILVAAARTDRRLISVDSEGFSDLLPNGEIRNPDNLVVSHLEEDRGRISIDRSAIVEAKPVEVTPLGATPVTASLTLPRPFGGTATYREEPGGPPSWTGDLTVDLPGASDVPLTGPSFASILCRGRSSDPQLRRCQGRADGLLFPPDLP